MRQPGVSHRRDQTGFTVIELLIATVMFTAVLMLVTTGIIHFSNQYYRAVNANATQNAARTISEEVTQSVQISGGSIVPGPTAESTDLRTLCVNTKKYWYRLGVPYADGASTAANPGLYVAQWDSSSDTGCENASTSFPTDGRQMLQEGMRLTQFQASLVGEGDVINVDLRVVYGDNDLLCSPAERNCGTGFDADNITIAKRGSDIRCRSTAGSQFCAVSSINATVATRVDSP